MIRFVDLWISDYMNMIYCQVSGIIKPTPAATTRVSHWQCRRRYVLSYVSLLYLAGWQPRQTAINQLIVAAHS